MKERPKLSPYCCVFKGKVFTIYRSSLQFENGKKEVVEYAVRNPYIGVFAFDKNNKLLVTREYRPKLRKTIWRIPIGSIDGNETARQAAFRELREETGMRAGRLKLFMRNTRSETFVYDSFFFVASRLTRDPLPQADGEEITVIPLSLARSYRMALQGGFFSDFISLGIIRLRDRIARDEGFISLGRYSSGIPYVPK